MSAKFFNRNAAIFVVKNDPGCLAVVVSNVIAFHIGGIEPIFVAFGHIEAKLGNIFVEPFTPCGCDRW